MTLPDDLMNPPTEEFCKELTERARQKGWVYDYVVIKEFLEDMWREAGLPIPDLEPYPEEP